MFLHIKFTLEYLILHNNNNDNNNDNVGALSPVNHNGLYQVKTN